MSRTVILLSEAQIVISKRMQMIVQHTFNSTLGYDCTWKPVLTETTGLQKDRTADGLT